MRAPNCHYRISKATEKSIAKFRTVMHLSRYQAAEELGFKPSYVAYFRKAHPEVAQRAPEMAEKQPSEQKIATGGASGRSLSSGIPKRSVVYATDNLRENLISLPREPFDIPRTVALAGPPQKEPRA